MKKTLVLSILFTVFVVAVADAVVVNFGHDRYIVCLTGHESSAVLHHPNAAGNYADAAARQALREIGMSPAMTGKAAQTAVFWSLRGKYERDFREYARRHGGGSFCLHYRCNIQATRFLLNDLTRVTDAWATSGAVMSEQVVQIATALITEILNHIMNAGICR